MTGWVVTLKLGKLKDNLFLIHCCSHLIYPNFYLFIYSCFFTAAAWASVCACVFFRHTCQSVPVFVQDWKAFHLRKSIKFLGFFHSFFFSFLQVKHCCASAAAAAKKKPNNSTKWINILNAMKTRPAGLHNLSSWSFSPQQSFRFFSLTLFWDFLSYT